MSGDPSARSDIRSTTMERDQQSQLRHPKFQISLTAMLLLMVVFAFISAALFYASQVPAIRDEISVLVYGEFKAGEEDVGRLAHRAFILFTFTSPLLLACVLSTALSILNFLQRKSS